MKRAIWCLLLAVTCVGSARSGESEPKTLLFSPITPEYLEVSAPEWARIGFGGFLLAGIMHNWDTDVWAVDGDPDTRGLEDKTLQRVYRCCRVCRNAGIEDNFLKVAFYSHLPDWFDDAGWEMVCDRFREGARLARLAGLRGVAIDIEYIAEIYHLDWKPYVEKQYEPQALRAKAAQRGEEMITAMLDVYPEMVLLTLPEGVIFYGPLATDLTVGFIRAAAKRNAPGGVHILTEGTYKLTKPLALLSHVSMVAAKMEDVLPADLRPYWSDRCSIAVGCWPLGYYRPIYDENGEMIGYSGKREKFGDEVVGSYADKSSNYPPEEFYEQYAFATEFARRYNWIYGHGATWWQLSEDEAKRYGAGKNEQLPVDERLDDFKRIVQLKPRLADPVLARLACQFRADGQADIADQFGLIRHWLLLGPFENKEDPPGRHTALRRSFIDTSSKQFPRVVTTKDGREMEWRECYADKRSGYIDATPIFEPNTDITYFALCYVRSPKKRPAQLRVGSNDGMAVWVNGEKIFEANRLRGVVIDDDIIDIVLPAGSCPILLQICQTGGTTGFYARITDEEGGPFDDLVFSVEP